MTGGWAQYSWVPAIALASCVVVFLMDFAAERYVEKKYGYAHGTSENLDAPAMASGAVDAAMLRYNMAHRPSHVANAEHHRNSSVTHQALHSGDQDGPGPAPNEIAKTQDESKKDLESGAEEISILAEKEQATERSFKQQIAGFLILEFGVIFHSVIIGLNLGTSAYSDFTVLYPVIVFQ
jgi:solute carrier family 39 (zinc transporter), member 1/2/3